MSERRIRVNSVRICTDSFVLAEVPAGHYSALDKVIPCLNHRCILYSHQEFCGQGLAPVQSLTVHCSDLVSCDTYTTYDNGEWVVQTCAIIGSRLLDAATFLAIDDVLQMKVKMDKGLALPRTSGCSCFMYCTCSSIVDFATTHSKTASFIKYCNCTLPPLAEVVTHHSSNKENATTNE